MKALLTSLCVLTISASAHAVSTLGYDFRADHNSTSYNTDANLPAYQKFQLKTGRLYFKGSLNERLSYDFRWAFNKPGVETATANSTRDSLNNSIELAFITDKMSDMFALSVGKLNTEIGGLEGATSGADLYMVTPLYAHTAVTTLSGANIGINQSTNNLLYATGVKGDLSFSDQHLFLVATNNISDSTNGGGKFNQDRGIVGTTWKGAFVEKTLTALLSYHEVSPQAATSDPGNKHTYSSAGLRYEDESMIAMLDYGTTNYKDGASSNKDTLWSALGKFGWKLEGWTPRLEVYTAEEKIGIATTTTNKFMGYGAVIEYKPTADNFRYHLAYNSVTTKPETGNDLVKNEIVVGARLFGDFLK